MTLTWLPYRTLRASFQRPASDPNKTVAAWLHDHTTPDQRVFAVGGRGTAVLLYSGRLTPGRHFTTQFTHDPKGRAEVLAEFRRNPPAYIVTGAEEKGQNEPDWFKDTLRDHYAPVETDLQGCLIYGRRPARPASPASNPS